MLPESGVVISQSHISWGDNEVDWRTDSVESFSLALGDKSFPCVFGRAAHKRQSCLILFVSKSNMVQDITQGLIGYTDYVRTLSDEERVYSPLVVFFEDNDFESLEMEHDYAWGVLQTLHDNDPSAWPENVPEDPDHHLWSFCFNGMPLFVNMTCPGHVVMKTRRLGDHICLVFNPRENFDRVASMKTRKGVNLRRVIRDKVAIYNNGVVPSALGFYEDKDNREWKQYQLEEEGGKSLRRCPLSMRAS